VIHQLSCSIRQTLSHSAPRATVILMAYEQKVQR